MNKSEVRILIIDDDQLMRTIIVSLIHREGYESVMTAKSGKEGIEKFLIQRPQIVFLDIDMLGLNGLETLHAIMGTGISTQVVMLSGIATDETVTEARKEGATGFIVKPPSQRKISDAIESYLKSSAFGD